MSGYVVGFLPVALVLLLSVIAPTFMAPMLQKPPELLGLPAGVFILGIGGLMMMIGFVLIRRIVDIEV
jgi:Flp pilus assembly protein TadB